MATPMIRVLLKDQRSGIVLTYIHTPVIPQAGNLLIVEQRYYRVSYVVHVQGSKIAEVYLQGSTQSVRSS